MRSIFDTLKGVQSSSLVKHASVYTLSNIFEKGIPFAILPILTRIMSQEDVGYFTLYQSLMALFLPLFTLSIDSSIILNYFKINEDKFRVYFSNGILLFFGVFIIFGTIAYPLSKYLGELVKFPWFWIIVIIVLVFFQFFTNLRKSLWQIKKKPTKYAYFSVIMAFVKNATGLLIIWKTDFGWKGIIIGHLLGQAVFAVYSVFSFYKERLFEYKFQKKDIWDIVKVGFPLSLHRFGAWLNDALNKVVISIVIGIAATGSYGIGATFGIGITIFQDAFNRAFIPYLFERLKNFSEKIRISLVRTTLIYYVGLISFSLFVSVAGYYMVGFIFGDLYINSRAVIIPLSFAAAFNGLYKMHTNYIFFTKKTYLIMSITLSMGVVNIGLVYFLVNTYGIVGAAYAALFSQFLSYMLTFYVGNRVFPVFFTRKRVDNKL